MAPTAPSRLAALVTLALVLALALVAPGVPAHAAAPVSGSASDYDGGPLAGVTVGFLPAGNADGAPALSATTGDDGDFEVVVPDGSYWVRYSKAGWTTALLQNESDEGPETVTVAGGAISGATLDVADGVLPDVSLLLPAPELRAKPRLTGAVEVGGTVTITPGTWADLTVDTDLVTVEWYLDGVNADEHADGDWSQKFDVPLAAVGKTLSFALWIDDPDGQRATAEYAGTAGVAGKATAALTGTVKGRLLTAVLAVPTVSSPPGSVVVKERRKTLGTITLKARGKGRLKLPKLSPGKHKLTLTYAGTEQIVSARTIVKITVK